MSNIVLRAATVATLSLLSACSSDSKSPGSASGTGGVMGQVGAGGGVPGGGTSGAGTSTGGLGVVASGGATSSAGATSSGGTAPNGGAGGVSAGAGGGGGQTAAVAPRVPTVTDTCPNLAVPGGHGTITVRGQSVEIWAGNKQADKKGAVYFYWHGTGGNSGEASSSIGNIITAITAEGGLVASFNGSTQQGDYLVDHSGQFAVWFSGDFEMADVIYACAVKQLNIDTNRIYTGGCSAGGLAAGQMAYLRSSYIAAAMPNSGGIIHPWDLEEPKHAPSVITTHGGSTDTVGGLLFETNSNDECVDIANKGGFAVDCNHGGGHCQAPAAVVAAQWEFLKAHPFGVSPEPYASALPADFPSYCKAIPSNGETYPPPRVACTSPTSCTNQACCYTQGPLQSNMVGESSACGPTNCPIQLCNQASQCTAGQICSASKYGYCRAP